MDYRDVAKKLRTKAADSAVTEEERGALLMKAAALEYKAGYESATTVAVPAAPPSNMMSSTVTVGYDKDAEAWLIDIIEEGYRFDGTTAW